MLVCPHCHTEICVRDLRHQGLWASFRICPSCGGKLVVDKSTKRRQAVFIIIALISLAFTVLLYFRGSQWLAPALASYAFLGVLIYWGNRQVFLVPYENGENPSNYTTHTTDRSGSNLTS